MLCFLTWRWGLGYYFSPTLLKTVYNGKLVFHAQNTPRGSSIRCYTMFHSEFCSSLIMIDRTKKKLIILLYFCTSPTYKSGDLLHPLVLVSLSSSFNAWIRAKARAPRQRERTRRDSSASTASVTRVPFRFLKLNLIT